MNQKPNISVKERHTAQPGNVQESDTHQNIQIHTPKIHIILYYNKGTIDYSQQCYPLHIGNEHYKQSPKKNSQEREREREREEERVRKEGKKRWKGGGKGEGKRGRESEKEKEKEKEEEEEEEKIEKKVLKKDLL